MAEATTARDAVLTALGATLCTHPCHGGNEAWLCFDAHSGAFLDLTDQDALAGWVRGRMVEKGWEYEYRSGPEGTGYIWLRGETRFFGRPVGKRTLPEMIFETAAKALGVNDD